MMTMRRIPLTLALALGWLVLLAGPAAAHSAEGSDATNFQTRLLSVTPQIPGLDVEVIEHGNRIQVTNNTGEEVVVLGYDGEPYLRLGPDGVAENLRSPATYLNQDRDAATAVPGSADPEAGPEWASVSDGNVARWHDHRIHWMGGEDPPAVRQDPDHRHTIIPEWAVPLQVGDTTVEAEGDLIWVPGPSSVPWLALAAVLFAATFASLWLLPKWRLLTIPALVAMVAADAVHAFGIGLESTGGLGSQLGHVLTGSSLSVVGWGLALVAGVLLARGRDGGLVAAAMAGILITVNGGVVEITALSRSQITFAWDDSLFRATAAIALGVGAAIFAICTIRLLRTRPEPATHAEAT